MRQGQEKQTDFIRVTVFGRSAENCDRYLAKGRQAAVQGRIQSGSYTNKEGQTVYTTDVVANSVEFLGGGQNRDDGQSSGQAGNKGPGPAEEELPPGFQAVSGDDIPF